MKHKHWRMEPSLFYTFMFRRTILTAKKSVHVVFWECFLRRMIFHFSTIDRVPKTVPKCEITVASQSLSKIRSENDAQEWNPSEENCGLLENFLVTIHSRIGKVSFIFFSLVRAQWIERCEEMRGRGQCDGKRANVVRQQQKHIVGVSFHMIVFSIAVYNF